MPTTALTQPTGTEVFYLFPLAGNKFTINGWSSTHIDNDVTNNPKSSVPLLVFERWKTIATDGGLDHTALDDSAEYPYLWNGLRWGIVYEYLKIGRTLNAPCTDSGWPIKSFDELMKMARHLVCDNLRSLGITSEYYCSTKLSLMQFDSFKIYK